MAAASKVQCAENETTDVVKSSLSNDEDLEKCLDELVIDSEPSQSKINSESNSNNPWTVWLHDVINVKILYQVKVFKMLQKNRIGEFIIGC